MSLPLNEKMKRVLNFLMGVRHPRVMSIMSTRGFTEKELEEGWQLFNLAAGAKLAYTKPTNINYDPSLSKQLLANLDNWENTWFPVVSATLERNYPAFYQTVFHNLFQTEGAEVIVSVGTLLDRLASLAQTENGKQALALLTTRGLTPEVRAQAASLIDQLQKTAKTQLPQIDPDSRAVQEKAINDVWAWFREWSQIARTIINRGDVLIRLGLRQPPSRTGATEDKDDTSENPSVNNA